MTQSDLFDLNEEWKTYVRDGITVLGSDPNFSTPVNMVFGIMDQIIPMPNTKLKLTSDDIKITLINNVYFIDNTTKALIAK